MCVLSIKVPIRKKSGNLFNDPRKSRAVGFTFDVGHTTDRDLAEPSCLRNMTSFILLR